MQLFDIWLTNDTTNTSEYVKTLSFDSQENANFFLSDMSFDGNEYKAIPQQMPLETAVSLLEHWLLNEPGYPQQTHWNGIREAIATLESNRDQINNFTDYHPGDLIAESKSLLEIATERYSD